MTICSSLRVLPSWSSSYSGFPVTAQSQNIVSDQISSKSHCLLANKL